MAGGGNAFSFEQASHDESSRAELSSQDLLVTD